MAAHGAGGGSCSPAGGRQPGCQLHTLTIEMPAFGPQKQLACPLSDITALPASLRHLTTPLPGQFAVDQSITCALSASHTCYLQGLVALLPGLESLVVTDLYQGGKGEASPLSRLQLAALHVNVADA